VAHEPAGDVVGADLDHERGIERGRLALPTRPAVLAARRAPGEAAAADQRLEPASISAASLPTRARPT
jgi:hypothetical protein